MTVTSTKVKVNKLVLKCKSLIENLTAILLEVTSLSGNICSRVQVVLPALLQMRILQQNQIQVRKANHSYQSKKCLYQDFTQELQWWINNLEFSNKKLTLTPVQKTIVKTDVSKRGWEGH